MRLAVFAGGALGAVARVGLNRALPAAGGWPWATFLANVGGTLLLGYVVTRLPPGSFRRHFVGIGFCAALTTFSTFQIEVLQLAHNGRGWLALLYLVASLASGLGALFLVTSLLRRTPAR